MVFDADVRYSGVSIGYTLSQVLGSAFAPPIATALYAATKTSNSIVAYLIAVSGFRRCPASRRLVPTPGQTLGRNGRGDKPFIGAAALYARGFADLGVLLAKCLAVRERRHTGGGDLEV